MERLLNDYTLFYTDLCEVALIIKTQLCCQFIYTKVLYLREQKYLWNRRYNIRTLNIPLVSISVQILDDLDTEEFRLLAKSAGADILEHIHVQRVKPDPKYFIGSGKAEEIAERVQALEIGLVIFDQALTPSQERNLSRVLNCRVIDRTLV